MLIARFLRRTRARRNDNPLRLLPRNFVERNLIVAMNLQRLPHLAKVLRQVVSKRIVVVEQQNHRFFFFDADAAFRVVPPAESEPPPCAISSAVTTARALFTVS